MTQKELIRRIKEYLPQSKYASQIEHIYLFGSYARNEQKNNSDIDLALDLVKNHTISYFDIFDIEEEMKKILDGKRIDLGTRKSLSPHIKDQIEKELIKIL